MIKNKPINKKNRKRNDEQCEEERNSGRIF